MVKLNKEELVGIVFSMIIVYFAAWIIEEPSKFLPECDNYLTNFSNTGCIGTTVFVDSNTPIGIPLRKIILLPFSLLVIFISWKYIKENGKM